MSTAAEEELALALAAALALGCDGDELARALAAALALAAATAQTAAFGGADGARPIPARRGSPLALCEGGRRRR